MPQYEDLLTIREAAGLPVAGPQATDNGAEQPEDGGMIVSVDAAKAAAAEYNALEREKEDAEVRAALDDANDNLDQAVEMSDGVMPNPQSQKEIDAARKREDASYLGQAMSSLRQQLSPEIVSSMGSFRELNEKTGLPRSVVAKDMRGAQMILDEKKRQESWQSFTDNIQLSPDTAAFLRESDDIVEQMSISMDKLALSFEKNIREINGDGDYFGRSVIDTVSSSWDAGMLQRQVNNLWLKELRGQELTEEEQKFLVDGQRALEYLNKTKENAPFWQRAVSGTVGSLGVPMAGMAVGAVKGMRDYGPTAMAAGAGVGAAMGSVAGGVGALPGAALGAGRGLAASAMTGGISDMVEQETAGLYATLKGITDEEGRVIDDDTARAISLAYGATAGLLEFAGEGAVAALLAPQLRKFLAGNVANRALQALLKSPAGKTVWGKALKTGLKTYGVETATEVSQTLAENTGEALALSMSDVNRAQKSGTEWLGDIWDTITQTSEAMLIPSVFGGGVHAVHYHRTRQDEILAMGQRRLKVNDTTAEFMQNSEAAKSDPVSTENLMHALQDSGTLPEQVYFNPEKLQEVFYQDGDEELMQIAEKMGVTPEKINEAMALGTDVAIDYSKAAAGIMSDKMRYAKLRNEMRLDPSDPNGMELEEIQKLNATEEGHLRELESVVKAIQDDEQKAQTRYEERLDIAKDYIEQMERTGLTKEQAAAYGTVLAAAAQRMAPAFGMTPKEYLQQRFAGYERMSQTEFERLVNGSLEDLLVNEGKNGGKAKANTAEGLATALHEEFTARQPKLNSTVENGILKGADTTLIGSRGDEKAHYEIREASSLIPSHDPTNGFAKRADYPEGVQERPYHSDVEEQNKVRQHAADLKPALLISDNAEASNGPSIITKDGIVLGGNSRVMTMQTAYADHPEKAAAYRAMLKERAERFGIDPSVVDGFSDPVLVRVVDEDMDVPGMAMRSRLYNETTTQGLQAKAEGVSRARMISDDTLAVMAADMEDFDTLREYLASPASKRLVESLINDGVIEKTQIARLVEDGKLTDEGKALVENALRGMIVQDYDVLQAAPASALQKLDRSILPLAQLKKRGGGWDMSKVVTDALRIIGRANAKDTSVSMLVGQNTLMQGANEASNAKKSVQAVALTLENATPKEVAARFAQMAKAAGHPGEGSSQGLLGVKAESNTPTTAFIESFLRTVATVDGKPVKDFNPAKNENHAALEYAFQHGGRGHSITTAQAAIEKQLHKKKISAEERERLRGYLSALGNLSGSVTVYPTKLGQFFSYQPGQALFQFIGQEGAARLDAAQEATRRLDNLAIARDMEKAGKDAKAIKLATGWERGADGKWRYEIDDSGVTFHPTGDARFLKDHPEYRRYRELEEKMLLGSPTEAELTELKKLSSTWKDERKRLTNRVLKGNATLENVLDAPELFTAYPFLRKLKLAIVHNDSYLGKYNHGKQTISLRQGWNWNGSKEVLLHEIQHAIQNEEGFAPGGSPSDFRGDIRVGEKTVGFAESIKEKQRVFDSASDDLKNKIRAINQARLNENFDEADRLEAALNRKERKIYKAYSDADFRAQSYQDQEIDTPQEAYRRLAGEAEARNVTARMNMTAQERLQSLASETEDVAREDQITLRQGLEGGAAMAESAPVNTHVLFQNSAPIVVSSAELGVPEGSPLKEYQKAAREIYRKLQKTGAHRDDLGNINITGAGFGEMKKTGFDLKKWMLVPRLKEIIESAEYKDRVDLKKPRKDRIVAFHWLEANVLLDGQPLRVGVNIAEDADGNKFYNLNEDLESWEERYKEAPDNRSGQLTPGAQELYQDENSSVENNISLDSDGVNLHILRSQPRRGTARGAMSRLQDGRAIVGLFKNRDASTVLHETSHFWLDELRTAAQMETAPDWVRESWEKLQKAYGFEGYLDDPSQFEQWREVQEDWARQFEAYCREGKAPSEDLQSAFNRFRSWLMDIYKTVKRLLGKNGVNEDVREVFDRLLATQEEIEASQRSATSASVLEEFVGDVAPELRDRYAKAVREAHDRASLAIANRRLVEQRAAEKEAKATAMAELLNAPEYQALAQFRGWGLPFEGLLAAVDEKTANNLRAKWGRWAKEKALFRPMKMSPEKAHAALQDVAEQLNMPTVEDLIGWLLKTPTEKEFIAQSVERSMQEWNAAYDGEVDYSDAMDEALSIELEALTGQKQIGTKSLRKEMNLRTGVKKLSEVDAEYKALKAAIRREAQVARKIVADVKKSTTADVKAKLNKAALEKLQKVKEQERMRRAALAADYRARIEREHILRQLKKISSSKSIPYEYMLQIRRTLQNWGLLPPSQRIDPVQLRGMPSFAAFMASNSLIEGDEITIPDWIENQNRGRPGDLSLERLREMRDVLGSVAHQGRTHDQMLGAMEKGRISDIAQKCKDQADKLQAIDDMPEESRRSFLEQARAFFRGLLSEMGFVRFMARRLDNYKNTGLFHRVLVYPLQQAQSRELALRKEYTDKLREVLKPLFDHGLQAKQFTIDGVPMTDEVAARWKGLWDMDKVYAVALNMGNAGNLKALTKGYGWTEQDLMKITSRLSSEEWQAIQKIWDTINELYPALNEVAYTLKGAPLPKVEGQSFTVVASDGKLVKMRGGYYPLIFDQTFSQKAEIQQNNDELINGMDTLMRKPNPRDGMTKERKGGTLPPRLSMQVLDRHISDTCHYISFAIPLRDTQRLTSEPAFRQSFIRAMGRENYQQLLPWLRGIARPGNPNAGRVERYFEMLTQRASIWALGMNLKSSLLQLTSMGNSWSEVGVVPFTRAAFRMILNPIKTVKEVRHHSAYMQARMQLFDDTMRREYDDIKKKDVFGLRLNGRLFSLDSVRQAQMSLIGILDSAVAMPTWIAAYEKAVNRGVTEDEAVAEADNAVVAAQGGGSSVDTASLMRNREWMRVLCPFMSFAMADNARKREAVGGLREWLSSHGQTGISPVQFSRRFAYESVLPVVLTVWLVGLGREGEPPEPEDYFWEALGFHTMGIPFARDISRALEDVFTGKKIGGRAPLALNWMYDSVKAAYDTGKAINEGDDKTEYRALKEIVNVAGFFAGVGTPQIWRTIEGSQAYFVDGEGGPLAPALGKPQKK